MDRHRQEVVGIQQPERGHDDAVPVRVRVIAPRDTEVVLEPYKPSHRVGNRAVHADLAVVIHRHETERRIDTWIYDNKVQPIEIADRLPVVHRCTAERIHPQVQAAGGNRLHVDHITKVLDIRRHEIISAYR